MTAAAATDSSRTTVPAAVATTHRRQESALHLAVAVGFLALVLQPMIATSRTFGQDWANHLWMLWAQGGSLTDTHGPSLFLNADPLGAFYPNFAFYGGTLYAVGGALSALLGGRAVVAYLVMWGLALGMAYGGLFWISYQAGLRRWRLHVAAIVYVTSAYVVTDVYTRGVLPELTATSALLLVLAAGSDLLRNPRLRVRSAVAFVIATVFFTGSHNIMLLWGVIFVALLLVPAIWAVGVRAVTGKRVLAVCGLGLLALGVNFWFLMPDVAFSSATTVAQSPGL